jgi:hypothetical protein
MKHANELKPTAKKPLALNKKTVMRINFQDRIVPAEMREDYPNKFQALSNDTVSEQTIKTSLL